MKPAAASSTSRAPSTYVSQPGGDWVSTATYQALFAAAALLFLTLFPHSGALGLASAPLFLLCIHRFFRLAATLDEGPAGADLGSAPSSHAGDAADRRRLLGRALGLTLVAFQLLRRPGDALLPDTSPYVHRLWALGLAAVVLWATRAQAVGPGRSPPQSGRDSSRLAWLAIVGTALTFAYLLRHAPSPRIDVFGLQQRGAELLLSGQNPYSALYPNPYDPVETTEFFGRWVAALDHYPYPPLSLLLSTASFRLTGDVRFLFLLAHLVVGAALYRLGGLRPAAAGVIEDRGLLLLCLHLLHPRGFLVVEQAWTEPLLAGAVALWLLGRGSARKTAAGEVAAGSRPLISDGLLLGLALACKQYGVLLLLPFASPALSAHVSPAWLRPYRFRWLLLCLLPLGLSYLPFFLWQPGDFIEDVVLFQLRQPFRAEALSLPALLHALSDIKLPGATAAIGLLVPLWFFARRRPLRLPAGTAGYLLLVSLQIFGFFATAKQAFCNYYYFLGVLLLLTLAQLDDRPTSARGDAAALPA
jgi:hypothetical protein